MKKLFHIELTGSYSESYGWDDGISRINVVEWTEDFYKEVLQSVVGNSYYSYPSLKSINEEMRIVYCNNYNGSRQIDGFFRAESIEEALEKAKKWAGERYELNLG